MNRLTVSSCVKFACVAAALVACVVSPASADLLTLNAQQVPTPESTFTISFGGQALPSSNISDTTFVLQVDDQPSPGSAQFNSYQQNVAPLTLPDGQGGFVNTGNLFVEIVPGSSGASTYDPKSGLFTTSETYKITYTGDLTNIGLENGGFVLFPSTSSGTITFDTPDHSQGRIHQEWSGTYIPLGIDYSCTVNTTFPEPASVSLMGIAALALVRRRR